MTETLSALLERVEAASGPDWRLNVDLECACVPLLHYEYGKRPSSAAGKVIHNYHFTDGRTSSGVQNVVDYTGSIDKAVRFAEKSLPGMRAAFQPGFAGIHGHILKVEPGISAHLVSTAVHPKSTPLAIIAAAIRALIALSPTERDARAMAGEG